MGRTSDARDRLIASGRDLMHERGYTAVGVAEVCARAGVQKGSFYHFFPTKQELALEVIDTFWAGACELLDELERDDLSPLARLWRFFERSHAAQVACREEHGRILGCPLGNLALEMTTQDDAVAARLRELFDAHHERFTRLLTQAVEQGELELADPRRTARSLLALVEGGVMLAKMHDDPELMRDLQQDARRLLGVPDA